jgi:hypothetical protein
MAQMRPDLSETRLDALPSRGEASFYRACRDQLPDHVLVLHSVCAVRRHPNGGAYDAETDFVICDSNEGILIVEVKGGGITFDPVHGEWSSIDRVGDRHSIKDPFRQAVSGKHQLLEAVLGHPLWLRNGRRRLRIGHAVFFPDTGDALALCGPAAPKEIIGTNRDLAHLRRWMSDVMRYWGGEDSSSESLGRDGLRIVQDLYCRPVLVRPMLKHLLAEEEVTRIRLTEQQSRLLRALGRRNRAAISGGAGTGKTLIALQRARELAEEGKATLFVCYNRPLADRLASEPRPENLQVMSFHQLCDWRVRCANASSGRDLMAEARSAYPHADIFDVLMPFALALSCECGRPSYDAIIVDEGQDFRDEYWLPLEMLLRDEKESVLYVFFDPNQALYTRSAGFPDLGEPFLLLTNCRNTRWIHTAAYQHYRGDPTDPPEIDGVPVEPFSAPSPEAQARRIHAAIVKNITADGLAPSDLAVLVAGTPKAMYYELLQGLPLPAGVRWGVESWSPDTVLIDTVARFKGLEANVVFLWGVDSIDRSVARETLYVGLSRAKSRLFPVGREAACREIIDHGAVGAPM